MSRVIIVVDLKSIAYTRDRSMRTYRLYGTVRLIRLAHSQRRRARPYATGGRSHRDELFGGRRMNSHGSIQLLLRTSALERDTHPLHDL